MVGWHHWLDGRESEQAPGVCDGQGGLACCSPWGRKDSDTTQQWNWRLTKMLNVTEWMMQIKTIMSHYYTPSIKKLLISSSWVGYRTARTFIPAMKYHCWNITGGSDIAKWYNQCGKLATSDKVKQACDLWSRNLIPKDSPQRNYNTVWSPKLKAIPSKQDAIPFVGFLLGSSKV